MPLSDSFKSHQSSNMRLHNMAATPTPDDLEFALSLAHKNPLNIVELPWKASDGRNYLLKVTCGTGAEEPSWTLNAGAGHSADLIWNYDSSDFKLVHSLIWQECEEKNSPALPAGPAAMPEEVRPQGEFQSTEGALDSVAESIASQAPQTSANGGSLFSFPANMSTSTETPVYQATEDISAWMTNRGGDSPPIAAQPAPVPQWTMPATARVEQEAPLAIPAVASMPAPSPMPAPAAMPASVPMAASAPMPALSIPEPPNFPSFQAMPAPPVVASPEPLGALSALQSALPPAPIGQPGTFVPPSVPSPPQALMSSMPSSLEPDAPTAQSSSPFASMPQAVAQQQALITAHSAPPPLPPVSTGFPMAPMAAAPSGWPQAPPAPAQPMAQATVALAPAPEPPPPVMAPLVEDDSPKPALSRRGFRLPGGPLDDTVGQPAPPLTPPVVRVPPAPALPQFSQPVIPAGTDIFVRTTTAEHTQSGTAPAFEQTASQQNMPPFLPPVPVLQPQSAPETAAVLGPAPDTAASRGPKQLPSPVELDRAAVDGVWGELTNAETGLLTQPAFLFFLVNEVQRHAQTQHPFAIVRFEMCVRYSGTETVLKPLPKRAVREAARRIFAQMRPLSLVGHYRETDYAFLLPLANREQATEFINQVHKNLMSGPLVQGMEVENLALFFGIASMPDDCNHPGVLLAAADEALTAAKSTNKTIVTYAEL